MKLRVPDRLSDGVVALRLLTTADVTAYTQAFRDDPDLGRLLGFDLDPGSAEVHTNLAGVAERARLGQAVEFAIEAQDDGRLLGSVLLFGLHERHRRCEVGFWVVPGARRGGYGRRAVGLALDWAFAELGLDRVEMTTTTENTVIPAFAQRLGFTYEGCLRQRNRERDVRVDILWFGLLRDEWTPPVGA